jgi:hypothetical protein
VEPSISKAELSRQLVETAQERSSITMIASFVILVGLACFTRPERLEALGGLILVLFFGPPLLLSWLMGRTYCRKEGAVPLLRPVPVELRLGQLQAASNQDHGGLLPELPNPDRMNPGACPGR